MPRSTIVVQRALVVFFFFSRTHGNLFFLVAKNTDQTRRRCCYRKGLLEGQEPLSENTMFEFIFGTRLTAAAVVVAKRKRELKKRPRHACPSSTLFRTVYLSYTANIGIRVPSLLFREVRCWVLWVHKGSSIERGEPQEILSAPPVSQHASTTHIIYIVSYLECLLGVAPYCFSELLARCEARADISPERMNDIFRRGLSVQPDQYFFKLLCSPTKQALRYNSSTASSP